MWGRLWSQTCALKACFRAGMGCFLQLKMFYCFKKMQGEKKSINIPLQSSLWNPQISIYLSSRGLWLSALILHLVDCEITISLASAVPVPGAVRPEGMIQREREVSTSKAREETVAAVSNTITPRTSIFYLMSLDCARRTYTSGTPCLCAVSGKLSKMEHASKRLEAKEQILNIPEQMRCCLEKQVSVTAQMWRWQKRERNKNRHATAFGWDCVLEAIRLGDN